MSIGSTDRQGMILALIGPAGSGKTTLSAKMTEAFPEEIRLSVSVTSRPAREREVDGRDYIFVDREKFSAMADAGDFFEWEETHGNLYGTLKSTVEESLNSGIDLILDIDIRGALNFKKAYPKNTIVVFIAVPSFELLLERLTNRGYMSEEELNKRLATARGEYESILSLHKTGDGIDYVLVNDDISAAEQGLVQIRSAEVLSFKRIHSSLIQKYCSLKESS